MKSFSPNSFKSISAISLGGLENNFDSARAKLEEKSPASMGSPLYGKISSACKAAAKRKFKVWPSAYASGWGVRCTKAGGPSKFGGGKKK